MWIWFFCLFVFCCCYFLSILNRVSSKLSLSREPVPVLLYLSVYLTRLENEINYEHFSLHKDRASNELDTRKRGGYDGYEKSEAIFIWERGVASWVYTMRIKVVQLNKIKINHPTLAYLEFMCKFQLVVEKLDYVNKMCIERVVSYVELGWWLTRFIAFKAVCGRRMYAFALLISWNIKMLTAHKKKNLLHC